MLLSVDQIAKSFGGNAAVGGVSFSVAPGEIVGIIGPNGSGKTTTMSMIAGLLPVDRGRIQFDGVDVTGAAPYDHRRRRIGATYQNARLFDELTLRHNVQLSAQAKRTADSHEIEARSQTWMEKLGLGHVADNLAFALSGGQRKLGELARVLVTAPSLVLLDEPTAGVAPSLHDVVADALREEQRRGTGIVLVSHDLPWTFLLASRIIVMDAGRVLLEGSSEDIGKDRRLMDAYLT
jgi:branched-chain amino acid transport system ATP-binding protein